VVSVVAVDLLPL